MNEYKKLFDWFLQNCELPLSISNILEGLDIDVSDCMLINGLCYDEENEKQIIKSDSDIEEFKDMPRWGPLSLVFKSLDDNTYEIRVCGDLAEVYVFQLSECGNSLVGSYSINCEANELRGAERLKLISGSSKKIN